MSSDPLVILGPGEGYQEAYMPDGSVERYEPEAATEAREERRDNARGEEMGERLERTYARPYRAALGTIARLRRQIKEMETRLRSKGECVDDGNSGTGEAGTGIDCGGAAMQLDSRVCEKAGSVGRNREDAAIADQAGDGG